VQKRIGREVDCSTHPILQEDEDRRGREENGPLGERERKEMKKRKRREGEFQEVTTVPRKPAESAREAASCTDVKPSRASPFRLLSGSQPATEQHVLALFEGLAQAPPTATSACSRNRSQER
jgi:hypothetical protein